MLSTAKIMEIKKSEGTAVEIEVDPSYPYALAGAFSRGLFLTKGESPGAVSHYILSSDNSTNYLSDMEIGDSVLSISRYGEVKASTIKSKNNTQGNFFLVKASCDDLVNDVLPYYKPNEICVFVQDCEKSGLVRETGELIKARELKVGDSVIVYSGLSDQGRHFGVGYKDAEREIKLIEK